LEHRDIIILAERIGASYNKDSPYFTALADITMQNPADQAETSIMTGRLPVRTAVRFQGVDWEVETEKPQQGLERGQEGTAA
jgi:hypothetical protein